MTVELRLLGVPAEHASKLTDLVKKSQWRVQPLLPGQLQAELHLKEDTDLAKLASRLFSLRDLHFELELFSERGHGERYLCVPGLGMRRQIIDELGRVLIPENELANFASSLVERPTNHASLYRELMAFAHQDRLDQLKIDTDSVALIPRVG